MTQFQLHSILRRLMAQCVGDANGFPSPDEDSWGDTP